MQTKPYVVIPVQLGDITPGIWMGQNGKKKHPADIGFSITNGDPTFCGNHEGR